MKIAFDIGHMGKVIQPLDRGAVYNNAREADYALLYAISARGHLEKVGHNVYLLCYGNYGARHKFCVENNIELHIQCHLNSTSLDSKPGNYALVLCKQHTKSIELASIVADKFKQLPVDNSKAEVATKDRAGYFCIMDDRPSLLIEPLFLNNPDHCNEIVEGNACFTIGKLLAEGILEWIDKN